MATPLEIRVNQKHHLSSLLIVKRANAGVSVAELQKQIEEAITVMEAEDVAYVEKILGVKAI